MLDGVRYPIVELRQYLLWPGQRDVLIELFDREFVESQEATGMAVVGQFRDLDQPGWRARTGSPMPCAGPTPWPGPASPSGSGPAALASPCIRQGGLDGCGPSGLP